MKTNKNKNTRLATGPKTHEGAPAKLINAEQQLRRSVMACLLWEDTFYENGVSIVDRIKSLIPEVDPSKVAEIAVEAREKMKLRHIPLLLVREMARLKTHRHLVADTLDRIIQRADELTEFVSIYWKDGRQPLSAQVKKGLAKAFTRFDEYNLQKYNRDESVKLRDVLFLSHAKPKDANQAELWKRLIADELATPDTWEVSLSASKGTEKKEAWERLLSENKLGALALIRNLRNFIQNGVDEKLVFNALDKMKVERVLPFRFITAARYAPKWEHKLEASMFKCLEGAKKLPGKTVLLIDVSGSMDCPISNKSELQRIDAANGLAILARELCENVSVYTFSNHVKQVAPRRGFALRDAIYNSQPHSGTDTGPAVDYINKNEKYDRLIILTDEQSHSAIPDPSTNAKGYVINVASYENGIGYGRWTHIDGWSEACLGYIAQSEGIDLE